MRAWRDAAISAGALGIILLVLISFDPRVREQVERRVSSPTAAVSDARHELRGLSSTILDAVRDRSLDHAPLVIFVFGAVVLLLFLLKT